MSDQPDSDAGRVAIGYARVSTRGQNLDQQRAALGAAGCIRVFEEKASGAKRDRPALVQMLDHLASRHESVESVRLLRTYGDHAARMDVSRRSGLRSRLSVEVQM